MFLAISFIAYSVIWWTLKKSRQQFPRTIGNRPNYILPFLIILSFAICYAIPELVSIFIRPEMKLVVSLETSLILLLGYINLLTDPLIYVLTNKNSKDVLVDMLHCSSCFI